MDVATLWAREQIRDLVARYNMLGDSGRFDELLDLFASDAVLQTDDETATGLEELGAFFTGVAGPTPSYVRHNTSTLVIDLTSSTSATARAYFFVVTGDGLDHWGRYADEVALVDDRWRFTRRRVRLDGMRPDGWAAAYRLRRSGNAGHAP